MNRISFHTTLASSFSYDLNFTCESDAGYESSMTKIPFGGDKVSLRTEYFYSEDAPGSTYDNVNMFINEILLALAASGSGILRLTEGQLIDLAAGDPRYTQALIPFLSSNFDTTDVSKPHAYLVWMLYDNDMNLIVEGSGAKRVTDPNALRELLQEDIPVIENGYLHAYVSNGGIEATSFDNFLVTYMRGKTRQINHYYPYGLTIAGIDGDYDEYLNKYTSKELQTGEFDPAISTGLEMLDFGSRFYDPQIGRPYGFSLRLQWHTPDPATEGSPYWTEQFANPYLAMGNNPVNGIDPNGEWFIFDSWIVGFVHGFFSEGSDRWQNGLNQANLSAKNDAKIIGGMYVVDPNKKFGEQVWEVVSRFTWQLPQTMMGYQTAQATNITQNANWVKHKYGATVVQRTRNGGSAVTLGNYIVGDNEIEADANNPLFQHEYGHYIQSQKMGWAYIPRVGIPSLKSALGDGDHDFFDTEQDANRRGFLYFNENVDGFYKSAEDQAVNRGWNFDENPLNIDGTRIGGQYVDFQDQSQIDVMNARLSISTRFYDYISWITPWTLIDAGIHNYYQGK